MAERDENGRLKLPKDGYIPFQRVLNRSNRSREPSQWGNNRSGGGSSRISHSHSYNNSGNDHQHAKPDDVTRSLGKLNIERHRKERRRSLTDAPPAMPKMPFIPFQRVQLRRRTTLPPPNNEFRLSSFTEERGRRLQRFNNTSSMNPGDPFSSEYNTNYKSQKNKLRAREKPSRHKNVSQINNVIRDKETLKWQEGYRMERRDSEDHNYTHDEEASHEIEANGEVLDGEKGDEESHHSADSRQSHQGSKYSAVSNDREETGSGHDDRAASTSSSVKFPQIRESSLTASDSARSVQGSGAAPPPRMPSLSSPNGSLRSTSQRPLSQTTVQTKDSSRWVEGKGACRMNLFFKIPRPPTEITLNEDKTSAQNKDSNDITTSEQNKDDKDKMSLVKSKDTTSPEENKDTTSPVENKDTSPVENKDTTSPEENKDTSPEENKDSNNTNSVQNKDNNNTSPEENKDASPVENKDNNNTSPVENNKDTRPSEKSAPSIRCCDTARWVEKKGAGRLRESFQLPKVGHIKNDPLPPRPTSPVPQNSDKSVSCKKNKTTVGDKLNTTINCTGAPRNTLSRSVSDSVLYLPNTHVNNYNTQMRIRQRTNEVTLFNERAMGISINKGARAKTALPRIILTLPDDVHGSHSRLRKPQDTATEKGAQKGSKRMTKVLSLPNIQAKVNLQPRPQTARLRRDRRQQVPDHQQMDGLSHNKLSVPLHINKTPKTEKKIPVTKTSNFTLETTAPQNRQRSRRHLTRRNSDTSVLRQKPYPTTRRRNSVPTVSRRSRRFSKSPRASARKSYEGQELTGPETLTWKNQEVQQGAMVKSHIEAIQLERQQREQRFTHFLGPSVTKPGQSHQPASDHSQFPHKCVETKLSLKHPNLGYGM
ncbi:Halomucin-like 1, partial [Homarus americanus]